MTFRAGEIPFTPKNLHALRTGGALLDQQQERHQQAMALRAVATTIDVPPVPSVPATDALERQRQARLRAYDALEGTETTYERCMRWVPVYGLVLAVGFVGVVTIMLAIMSVRVSNALNTLDGDSLSAKVETLLDYGIASAKNTHAATGNVAVLTAHAANTAAMAAPKLQHAVNDTASLVDDLRSWSFHPSIAIAPGGHG